MTVAARLMSLGLSAAAVVSAIYVASSVRVMKDWVTNSDQLTMPAFIVDIFANPSNFFGWQLPRASYLFPDTFAYAVAFLVTRDPLGSILLAQVPVLLIWIYVLFRAAPRPEPHSDWIRLAWAISLGLLIPLVMTQLSKEMAALVTRYLFSFANHFTSFVFAVLLLVWSLDFLAAPSRGRLAAVGLTMALIAASNRSIWAFYLLPAYVVLLLTVTRSPARAARTAALLAMVTTIAAGCGYLVENSFNRIAVMPYELSATSFAAHARLFQEAVWNYLAAHPFMAICLVLLVAFYVVACYRVLKAGPGWWRRELGSVEDAEWLFDVALLVGAFVNVVATMGAWQAIGSERYLMMFFFAPALLVRRVFLVPVTARMVVAPAVVLLAVSAVAFNRSDESAGLAAYARRETGALATCLQTLNVNRGLASYWIARRSSFLSNGDLRIEQLTPWPTGKKDLLFYWGNNAYAFLRGHPDIEPYDYIIADGLDHDTLKDAFGPPDAVQRCANREIWKYDDKTRLFVGLLQGHVEPYQRLLAKDRSVVIQAAVFGSNTGIVTGLGREADPKIHSAGAILQGSRFQLRPGTYRFTLSYASTDTQVASGTKIGTFEIARGAGKPTAFADLFAHPDRDYGEASVLVGVDDPAEYFEPRVQYAATGMVRLDRIAITEVDRADEIRLWAGDAHLHTLVGIARAGVIASTGKSGVLLYGPYLPLPPGSYRASVYFASDRPQATVGKIDVAVEIGRKVLAERRIDPSNIKGAGSSYRVDLDFKLARAAQDFELRVFVDEGAIVDVAGYEVVPYR